jgi:hypothetical protein
MKKCISLCLTSTFIFISAARAADLTANSTTELGKDMFSQSLSLSGNNGGGNQESETAPEKTDSAKESGQWNWSAGYTYSKAPVGTSSNTTNSVDGSLGYRRVWDLGLGLNYSNTPAERLSTFGPNLWAGYEFNVGHESDGFQPTLEPKLTFKNTKYQQTYSGTTAPRAGSRRTVARPVTGKEQINQKEIGLELDYSISSIVSARAAFSSYSYDKDVNHFIGLLDSPRAVATGASSFSTTLGGFPKSSAEIGATVYPAEEWSLDLTLTRTKIKTDNSKSSSAKLVVSRDIGKSWRAGLGFERDKSASQGSQNLGLLNLALYL